MVATVTVAAEYALGTSTCSTQGNNATQDSNGMCHLMPRWHLPEWRKEDAWAFVHRDSWIPNKGLDNTMPATASCIYNKSL